MNYTFLLRSLSIVAVFVAFMLPEVDRLSILVVVAAANLTSYFFARSSSASPHATMYAIDGNTGDVVAQFTLEGGDEEEEEKEDEEKKRDVEVKKTKPRVRLNQSEDEFITERNKLVRDRRLAQPIGDREKFAEFLLQENTELINKVNKNYFM